MSDMNTFTNMGSMLKWFADIKVDFADPHWILARKDISEKTIHNFSKSNLIFHVS